MECYPDTQTLFNSDKISPDKISPDKLIDNSDHCYICGDNFINSDLNITLPCNHQFHSKCLNYTFKYCNSKSYQCPYCRDTVTHSFILSLKNKQISDKSISNKNKLCKGIFKTGLSKGTPCTYKCFGITDFCKRHQN